MRNTILFGVGLAALLAACAPAEEGAASDSGGEAAVQTAEVEGQSIPDEFEGTAWRVMADDGARYVTYLDADGTYRDLRNGDPWQEGSWSHDQGPDGKVLCFTPDDDNGIERCWSPGLMEEDVMTATNAAGRRIELEKVDYTLPPEDDEAA